jgi:hypothetical protein
MCLYCICLHFAYILLYIISIYCTWFHHLVCGLTNNCLFNFVIFEAQRNSVVVLICTTTCVCCFLLYGFSLQIPFYPVVKKDLTFIHLGNDSKVEGLINFEKLRMIAKEVRALTNMCSSPYDLLTMLGLGNILCTHCQL